MTNVRMVLAFVVATAGVGYATSAGAQSSEMFYYLGGANYYDVGGYTRGPLSESHVTRARIRALRQPPTWLDLKVYPYQDRQPPTYREQQPPTYRLPSRPVYPYQEQSGYIPHGYRPADLDGAGYRARNATRPDFDSILRKYSAGQFYEPPKIPDRIRRNGEVLWLY